VVITLAIGSTVVGAEEGALAMREPRSAAPETVPAAAPFSSAAAATRAPQPDAQSASLRFWRNGGLPDARAADESAPLTVVIADVRSPATHDGIGRAVAIWRDGGAR
jgi:hypothetical protein